MRATRLSKEEKGERNRITGFMLASVVPALGASIVAGPNAAFAAQWAMVGPQGVGAMYLARKQQGKSLRGGWTRQETVEAARMAGIASIGLGAGLAASVASGGNFGVGIAASMAASPVQGVVGTLVNRAREGRTFGRWQDKDTAEMKRWVGIGSLGSGVALAADKLLKPILGESAGLVAATAFAPGQGFVSAKVNAANARKEARAAEVGRGGPPVSAPRSGPLAKAKSWVQSRRQQSGRVDSEGRTGRRWSIGRRGLPLTADQAATRAAGLAQIATVDRERANSAWGQTNVLERNAARLHQTGVDKSRLGREQANGLSKSAKDKRTEARGADRDAKRLGEIAAGHDALAARIQNLSASLTPSARPKAEETLQQHLTSGTQFREHGQQRASDATQLRSEAAQLGDQGKQVRGQGGEEKKDARRLYGKARKLKAGKLSKAADRSERTADQAANVAKGAKTQSKDGNGTQNRTTDAGKRRQDDTKSR